MIYRILLFLTIFFLPFSLKGSEKRIRTLYNSLDQNSAVQHLSFYELYPNTEEGQKALIKATRLLTGKNTANVEFLNLTLEPSIVDGIVSLLNKQPNQEIPELSDSQLETIEKLAIRLSNRRLKGFQSHSEKEILLLSPHEIDIARAVILSQMDKDISFRKIRSYEAMIDLMALQILAKLPSNANPQKKIRAINAFIFEEMGFRFPPHSKYAEAIDLYTFLPSVLDSRHGVCLGVSILYLSLAQRLDLPLEAVTPPGHIYIRYKNGNHEINIETTARGVHIPSEDYLGIDTRKLQERNFKEVVGLAHFNNASVYLKDEKYKEAIECYDKALCYLPADKLALEFKAYCHLFIDDTVTGTNLLREVADDLPEYAVSKKTVAGDYLAGRADKEAIKALFLSVDEKRASILKKKDALQNAVEKNPEFREGWQSLAIAWLQLHRIKEALAILEHSHELNPDDPTVEYYLAIIYHSRLDYQKAWKHLKIAEEITASRNHYPKALKHLRRELAIACPE